MKTISDRKSLQGGKAFSASARARQLNTEDPVSWSEALQPFGMKLAYLPFDARKMRFYMEELVNLDDLFLLSYYSGMSPRHPARPG